MQWRLELPASRLFAQSFIQAQIKETSKLRVTGLCDGNSPVTGEVPAQRASKFFHLMTSSCQSMISPEIYYAHGSFSCLHSRIRTLRNTVMIHTLGYLNTIIQTSTFTPQLYVEEGHPITGVFPAQTASDAEMFPCNASEKSTWTSGVRSMYIYNYLGHQSKYKVLYNTFHFCSGAFLM